MSSPGDIERIYLDSASGQRPSTAIFELASPILGASWNDGLAAHHDAKSVQLTISLALETLASAFKVKPENILPVHRLGNAIDLLAKQFPSATVSKVSRKAAIDKFQGEKLDVDHLGRLQRTPTSGAVFFPAANQETGVIENFANFEFSNAIRIVDATEWYGRTTREIPGEFLIARASSWGGPHSVCFIISKDRKIDIDKRVLMSISPDTFNLLVAATAWENLSDISELEKKTSETSKTIRDALSKIEAVRVHGDDNCLPHLISFDIENVDSESAAMAFDVEGISIGSGSACGAESINSSHVLDAMEIQCSGNLRISMPLGFSSAELEYFLEKLPKVISKLTQTL